MTDLKPFSKKDITELRKILESKLYGWSLDKAYCMRALLTIEQLEQTLDGMTRTKDELAVKLGKLESRQKKLVEVLKAIPCTCGWSINSVHRYWCKRCQALREIGEVGTEGGDAS